MATPRPRLTLLDIAGLVLVIAGLRAAAPVLVPFAFAIFLAILSLPLLAVLERRLPGPLAVLLTVLANVGVLVGLIALLSGSATAFLASLPRYRARWNEIKAELAAWLEAADLPGDEWLTLEQVDPSAVLDVVSTTLLGVASLLTNLLLVILFLVFLLLETRRLPNKLRLAFGESAERSERFDRAGREVQRYLVIKTMVSLATGCLVGLGVWAIGLDFPLLWGTLAFLLNYIPNLGSVIAAVPAVLLALLQLGLAGAIAVGALYLAVNFLFGNLLEPQLMGRRLGLSPLVVFLTLIFGGWLWGPLGMFLAVPLIVMARIVLEQSERYRWVAVLLAARPTEPAAPPPDELPAT